MNHAKPLRLCPRPPPQPQYRDRRRPRDSEVSPGLFDDFDDFRHFRHFCNNFHILPRLFRLYVILCGISVFFQHNGNAPVFREPALEA
jgi:hypothetical protein